MSRTTFNSENVGRAIVSDSLKPHGNRQAPLSMGFPRQEYWSVLSFPSPEDLPDPGIRPRDQSQVSCIAGGFFTLRH